MNTLLPSTSTHRPRLVLNFDVAAASGRHGRRRHPKNNQTEITIDVRRMRRRAAEVVDEAAMRGKRLWKEIRTSITVLSHHDDQRLLLVVRRSSLQLLACAVILSAFVVVIYKWIMRIRRNADAQGILRRRDRSLGGREVVVSRRKPFNSSNYFVSEGLTSPLSYELNGLSSPLSISEREVMKGKKEQAKKQKKQAPLPSWWPAPDIPSSAFLDERKAAQFRARALIKVIMDNRMNGKDFAEEEILQLRQICKTSDVNVSFPTDNVRDSFYRAAIAFVLTTCSGSANGSSLAQIGGEDATRFIAGLAGNIGLKSDRAATMVNAAVAARTRSLFLQAWALLMQGKDIEAHEILLKIFRMHTTFPSETNSPEIEMVAEGLKRHIKLEGRKKLLNMYMELSGTSNSRVAVEALGLVSSWEGTNNYIST